MTPALRAAFVGGAIVLLLQGLPPAGALLEYRREFLAIEPWRALTGHFVHVNWTHALVNAGAWLLLARLFEPLIDARRQWLYLALSALVISVALALFFPLVGWYRGASGMLHALYFAGATRAFVSAWQTSRRWPLWSAAALVAGGWIKVALEQPFDGSLPYSSWLGSAVVPQVHLVGAIVGSGLGFLRRNDRASTKLSE